MIVRPVAPTRPAQSGLAPAAGRRCRPAMVRPQRSQGITDRGRLAAVIFSTSSGWRGLAGVFYFSCQGKVSAYVPPWLGAMHE